MLDTFWNLFQQMQIADNKLESKGAASIAAASSSAVDGLRSQLDTLVLANQAMWELLSEKHGLSESDLVKKMNEIDLRDGKFDGRVEKARVTVAECTECGQKVGKRRTNCYWCGARIKGVSPFSG